jgi:hypothetical protein
LGVLRYINEYDTVFFVCVEFCRRKVYFLGLTLVDVSLIVCVLTVDFPMWLDGRLHLPVVERSGTGLKPWIVVLVVFVVYIYKQDDHKVALH